MKFINSILDLLLDRPKTTGALIDDRPKELKLKDFTFDEIVSAPNPVRWIQKDSSEWRKFPDQDQRQQFSCVAQSVKKMKGIWYFLKTGTYVEFSAAHIYARRANKPFPGMAGVNALDIDRKEGVTLEQLVPSTQPTDKEIDAMKIEPYKAQVGEVFRSENFVVFPDATIDTIASTIKTTRKGVMVWFYFLDEEWARMEPVILDRNLRLSDSKALRHSMVAVDYTLTETGKKALVIEDSAHFGGLTRRLVTEDFFRNRNFFAAYIIGFKFDNQLGMEPLPESDPVPVTQKPLFTFNVDLHFTEDNTILEDVRALQDILKFEGFFPKNVESTGRFGALTARGVLAFQKKYKIAPDADLNQLAGRTVGPKTRAKLNELYAK